MVKHGGFGFGVAFFWDAVLRIICSRDAVVSGRFHGGKSPRKSRCRLFLGDDALNFKRLPCVPFGASSFVLSGG